LTFQAAAAEWLSWLEVEANHGPSTVRTYRWALRRLGRFLADHGHSLRMADLHREDLRAYQRHLADTLPGPASRAAALVACRSWLRWLAREDLVERDVSDRITLPKIEQRLPKPLTTEDLARVLRWAAQPSRTPREQRDRALVLFLLSTGCRISEALRLDRTDIPRDGDRLVVTGKGSKQRTVYLTNDARAAMDAYLHTRHDVEPALFVNCDRVPPGRHQGQGQTEQDRRLTTDGARKVVRQLQRKLGAWSLRSPHVLRHTMATGVLEAIGGDVRLVQELLGHAGLSTLQVYTKIVDSRKQEAYRQYQRYLTEEQASLDAPTPRPAAS
jgi:site-specific recombinase XerD